MSKDFRETLGSDCFADFCRLRGKQFTSLETLTRWWTVRLSSIHTEAADIVRVLLNRGLLIIQYEPGVLVSDGCRSREYVMALVHRDVFPAFEEFCQDDETFEYIFTDAETESALKKKEKALGKVDIDARKARIMTMDQITNYYVYAQVHFPIAPLFHLQERLANHILNNYVCVQVFGRECKESTSVLAFLRCFTERIVDQYIEPDGTPGQHSGPAAASPTPSISRELSGDTTADSQRCAHSQTSAQTPGEPHKSDCPHHQH
jgi:hypothetical protein